MKKLIEGLSELKRLILLGVSLMIVLCLLSLIPLFVFSQPGWLIGVAIGSIVGIVNVLLTYKGSEVGLKSFKTFYFMLFYFVRIVLILVSFVLTALFQFGFIVGENVYFSPIDAFNYSLWGDFIGVVPMQIVLVIVMVKTKKNSITISENIKKDE